MNKRGQLFILAAIIICVLVYQVTAKYNTAKEYGGVEGFKELSENYYNEIRILYNKDKLEGKTEKEIIGSLSAFSKAYKKFVGKEDPNMGFLFIYKDEEGVVHIENLLGKDAQGNDRELILRYSERIDPEKTVFKFKKLFNQEERVQGTINLAFMGSMGKIKVSTPLVSFGEEFVKADLENVEELKITIPGVFENLHIPLEQIRTWELGTSERPIQEGEVEISARNVVRDVSISSN